jgi:hypothetical protein
VPQGHACSARSIPPDRLVRPINKSVAQNRHKRTSLQTQRLWPKGPQRRYRVRSGAETRATPAGGGGIGIFDDELSAFQVFLVVDFGTD